MGLKEEIEALEKASQKELIKVIDIDKKTKIEYLMSTMLNIMFRWDEVRVFFIGIKKKGIKK